MHVTGLVTGVHNIYETRVHLALLQAAIGDLYAYSVHHAIYAYLIYTLYTKSLFYLLVLYSCTLGVVGMTKPDLGLLVLDVVLFLHILHIFREHKLMITEWQKRSGVKLVAGCGWPQITKKPLIVSCESL